MRRIPAAACTLRDCSGKHLEPFNFCSRLPMGLCRSFNSSPWVGRTRLRLLSQEARRRLPVKKVWGRWLGFDREQLSTPALPRALTQWVPAVLPMAEDCPLPSVGECPSSAHPGIWETCTENRWVGARCENLTSGQGAQASLESLWGSLSTSQKAGVARASISSSKENPGAEGAGCQGRDGQEYCLL